MSDRTFALIGAGNMGCGVLGVALSAKYKCIVVDKDELKVKAINDGTPIVPEEGFEEEIKKGLDSNRLFATTDISLIKDYRFVFVAVQTPVIESGCDYSVLLKACSEVFQNSSKDVTVIIGSTLFPGGVKKVLEVLESEGRTDIELIYEPVFLRAGKAIKDYSTPGKCVLGVGHQPREETISFFHSLVECEKTWVSYETAEWIKLVHNMFLCVKVAFANEVAEMCPWSGTVLETVFNEDEHGRILTKSHLRPGPPYSGPCLPKDIKMASNITRQLGTGYKTPLILAAKKSNELYLERIAAELWNHSGGDIGIVGCAFRPGFNELRDSLFLELLERFEDKKNIKAYDPALVGISGKEFKLMCRGDKRLLKLKKMITMPLEEVWKSKAILVNKIMTVEEEMAVVDLPVPWVVNLYKFF